MLLRLVNLNSIINASFNTNKHLCYIKKTKAAKRVLECLMSYGIIKEIQKKGQKYLVTLQNDGIDSYKPSLYLLKSVSTISRQVFIRKYKLHSLIWLNRRKNYIILTKDGTLYNTVAGPIINTGGLILSSIATL